MLPSLLDLQTNWRPSYDTDQMLLLIDNNPYSLANVLKKIRDTLYLPEKEAADKLREHIYSKYSGPVSAARGYNHDTDTVYYLEAQLQRLLDTKTKYYKTYLYWIDVLNHYRNKHKEGCCMEEYLPDSIERKKREEQLAGQETKRSNGVLALSDDLALVLKSILFDHVGKMAILPASDLGKKVYEKVKSVMEDYGGKWNTSKQSFVFPSRADIERLEKDLKAGVSVNQRTKKQAFYTPDWLVKEMIKIAGVKKGHFVLEPSAGRGSIASRLRRLGAVVFCVEKDTEDAAFLKNEGYCVKCADFLAIRPPSSSLGVWAYDAVVMNPPFTRRQDVKHILHAYKFLKPGRKLVSVCSKSVSNNTKNKHCRELANLIEECGHLHEIPDAAFMKSGTNVKTTLVVLRKPR